MTAWLDRVAADLLHVEHLLRTTLRSVSRGGKPERLFAHDRIWITGVEARTLLRGAMPAPIAATRMRQPHARVLAAMSIFSGHLVTLNDPLQAARPEAAISAACQLVDELRRWAFVGRWSAACRAARVRIPVPITAVLRQQTVPAWEHLPNAWAGARELEARGGRPAPLPRQVRRLRAEQAELDLAAPSSAEVVDIRQMRLELVPPPGREACRVEAAS